jgi:diguanylate cyclase (GGDEF)-like protein
MKTTVAMQEKLREVEVQTRPTVKKLLDEISKLREQLELQDGKIDTLKKQALEDPLTCLPNRRAFEKELKKVMSYYKRYNRNGALLLIDIDAFKSINDTLGHLAGDALLKHLATQLKNHIRETDFVARLGGDEFCILLREVSQEEVTRKVEELNAALSISPCLYETKEVYLSVSIGQCMFGSATCKQELLDKADRAMYAHKNNLTLIDNS